jgi:hypothetical protein
VVWIIWFLFYVPEIFSKSFIRDSTFISLSIPGEQSSPRISNQMILGSPAKPRSPVICPCKIMDFPMRLCSPGKSNQMIPGSPAKPSIGNMPLEDIGIPDEVSLDWL